MEVAKDLIAIPSGAAASASVGEGKARQGNGAGCRAGVLTSLLLSVNDMLLHKCMLEERLLEI